MRSGVARVTAADSRPVTTVRGNTWVVDPRMHRRVTHDRGADEAAVEEPLEIRVDGKPIAVTMRTPGNDEELALGFLHGEGLLDEPRTVRAGEQLEANTVDVAGPLLRDPGERSFYATSSCGVCGKGAIEQIVVDCPPLRPGPTTGRALLAGLPDRLSQPAFEVTGGLHATGIFSAAGETQCVREDVGRHNAMDKAIGWALIERRIPLTAAALCASGRLSFELVQKAAVAGCPILVGVGAPSSLAIELASERGMTLGGFAREGRINIYAGSDRVRD
jgi:FdhD protein